MMVHPNPQYDGLVMYCYNAILMVQGKERPDGFTVSGGTGG